MSGIPYNELQTINCKAKKDDGESATIAVLHYAFVIPCRDCKHFTPKGTHKFENGKTNADYCKYVRGWMLQITPDGYCKWGERRQP